MIYKFRVAFYLRDKKAKNSTSLLLSISTGNGQRDIISSGIKLSPNAWDTSKMTSKDKTVKDEIKRIIEIIENYEINIRFENKREYDFFELKNLLFAEQPERLETIKTNDLFSTYIGEYYELNKNVKAFNTIKKYKTLKTFFVNHYPKLRAKDINNEFADKLKAYYLVKKQLNNTINKNFQLIRVVLKWLFDTNKLKPFVLDKFRHSADDKVEEIALEKKDIEAIQALDLSKTPNLDLVRDLFLLSCHTGVDWIDLKQLVKNNLFTSTGGHTYFLIKRAKTAAKRIMSHPPFTKEVEAIMIKHNWNLKFISYQNSLDYLKKVCELAKLEEIITLKSMSGTQMIQVSKAKYEWIGWKTGRRTFITNHLLDKTSTEAVSFVVGHSKTATTAKYHHASTDHMVDLLYKK